MGQKPVNADEVLAALERLISKQYRRDGGHIRQAFHSAKRAATPVGGPRHYSQSRIRSGCHTRAAFRPRETRLRHANSRPESRITPAKAKSFNPAVRKTAVCWTSARPTQAAGCLRPAFINPSEKQCSVRSACVSYLLPGARKPPGRNVPISAVPDTVPSEMNERRLSGLPTDRSNGCCEGAQRPFRFAPQILPFRRMPPAPESSR